MIKKCKQCGKQLVPGESNNVCESCRKKKRDVQSEIKKIRDVRKGKDAK